MKKDRIRITEYSNQNGQWTRAVISTKARGKCKMGNGIRQYDTSATSGEKGVFHPDIYAIDGKKIDKNGRGIEWREALQLIGR